MRLASQRCAWGTWGTWAELGGKVCFVRLTAQRKRGVCREATEDVCNRSGGASLLLAARGHRRRVCNRISCASLLLAARGACFAEAVRMWVAFVPGILGWPRAHLVRGMNGSVEQSEGLPVRAQSRVSRPFSQYHGLRCFSLLL